MATHTKPRTDLPDWWVKFFDALVASGGNYAYAHHETSTAPLDLEIAIQNHPHLGRRLDTVPDILQGKLMEAAVTRAVDGWDEPVFHQGEDVGSKRKYSDPLLVKLLNAYVPACDPKKTAPTGVTPELVHAVLEQIRKARNGPPQTEAG